MSSISLEDVVKNNLANYEARYDANDWTRMEGMLVTTPDSSPFNWKPVLITFIALIVLGGGYALYTTIDFSKPVEKPATVPSTPPPVVKKTLTVPVKKENPPPVPPPHIINEDSLKQFEEDTRIAKEEEDRNAKIEAEREEARIKKEKNREEPTKEELEAREARRARRKALAASDSNKTDSSKESVKEPKKEKAKSSSIGFNIFSTLNVDSLKKYQEKSKKDSVK